MTGIDQRQHPGMKWKNFSKKIQLNKINPSIIQRKELANAALAQTKEDKTTQRQALKVAVLQTHTKSKY